MLNSFATPVWKYAENPGRCSLCGRHFDKDDLVLVFTSRPYPPGAGAYYPERCCGQREYLKWRRSTELGTK